MTCHQKIRQSALILLYALLRRLCETLLLHLLPTLPVSESCFIMSDFNTSSDAEKGSGYSQLINDTVQSYCWSNVTVTVKDRKSRESLDILSDVNGIVQAGELLALMGPRLVSIVQELKPLLTCSLQRLRQNNSPQRSGPACYTWKFRNEPKPLRQRIVSVSRCLSQDEFVCRAGGHTDWFSHRQGNALLCCQTCTSKVSQCQMTFGKSNPIWIKS